MIKFNNIACVIFDCDGVLVNSEEIYTNNEIEFLKRVLNVSISRDIYLENYSGLSADLWRKRIEENLCHAGIKKIPDEEFENLKILSKKAVEANVTGNENIAEVLGMLKNDVCVVSNSSRESLIHKLKKSRIYDFFEGRIYSAENVSRAKPFPDIYLYALEKMGRRADTCLAIEDSVSGVTSAKTSGIATIGYIGGKHCTPNHGENLKKHGADYIIKDFLELPLMF